MEPIAVEEGFLAELLVAEADEFLYYHSTDNLKCFKRFSLYFSVLVAALILYPIFERVIKNKSNVIITVFHYFYWSTFPNFRQQVTVGYFCNAVLVYNSF